MKNIFRALFCAIIVDFFYYSSVFSFTMGYNTKLIMSVLGLITFIFMSIRSKSLSVSRQMVVLTLLALGVSMATLFSMVYNNTGDRAYLSYVLSMLVWIAAAYMVAVILKSVYGKITIELVADFIIALSVFQCAIAILGDIFVPVNNFIRFFTPWTQWLDMVDRMYGIGDTTTLDTGGIRYSIACVLCAHMLIKTGDDRPHLIPWYLFAFIFITIIGNMIARTTTVGAIIALVYIIFYIFTGINVSFTRIKSFLWLVAILSVMIGVSVWLYNTNDIIYKNLRFGFEGFFSLSEKGEWDVNSNNTLRSMYVFPDNPKTWLIGDGYFIDPSGDPNFIGDNHSDYYMDTDVGYLRFIFYFGLLGLLFFSSMILYAGYICLSRFPGNALLFLSLILIHFIVWLKVSTDCFFIFGLFIAMSFVRDYSGESDPTRLTS